MKKFPFSLSWKLTLCSILMMLLMWAAVGVVLVLNTAEEIMTRPSAVRIWSYSMVTLI
mgnify:CR=1 FL=1